MAIDVETITTERAKERAAVANNDSDSQLRLELRYIADSLEALRREMGGIAHLIGRLATKS